MRCVRLVYQLTHEGPLLREIPFLSRRLAADVLLMVALVWETIYEYPSAWFRLCQAGEVSRLKKLFASSFGITRFNTVYMHCHESISDFSCHGRRGADESEALFLAVAWHIFF